METVERQHESTEPSTLTDSTIHSTQNLEPFIGVCVNIGPSRQMDEQGGRRLCVHQMWRNMARSITGLKTPGYLLLGSSEKHYVRWASSWYLDPSTVCPLFRHSPKYSNERGNPLCDLCMRAWHPMKVISNTYCDMDGMQTMYCVPVLFVWSCSAVLFTVRTMHFRTKGDMIF